MNEACFLMSLIIFGPLRPLRTTITRDEVL